MPTSPNGAPQLTWANIVATIAVLALLSGGLWAVFQTQFTNQKEELEQLRSQLLRFRSELLLKVEHEEFAKRLDRDIQIVRDQLRVIETTRPTTGELQAISSNSVAQINKVEERVRSLEEYLRTARALAPVTQAPR